ncbi:uncharacterized protein [Zea mays]|uniref:uncharacterized protein n=1 Tax=Zea mays TaxID=4577 RepID=UPI0016529C1F|nr:uncharacterized protein LOC118476946 [Zea mays]
MVPRSLDCHQFRRWTVEAWAIARRTWELSLCRAASGTELISIKSPVSGQAATVSVMTDWCAFYGCRFLDWQFALIFGPTVILPPKESTYIFYSLSQEQVPQDEAHGGCYDEFVRGLDHRLPVNLGCWIVVSL